MSDMITSGPSGSAAGTIAVTVLTPSCLNFGPVKVYPDGRVERTDTFTTDEAAAMAFWKAVEMYMPISK